MLFGQTTVHIHEARATEDYLVDRDPSRSFGISEKPLFANCLALIRVHPKNLR
jgi:hypothetical protein